MMDLLRMADKDTRMGANKWGREIRMRWHICDDVMFGGLNDYNLDETYCLKYR